MRSLLKTSKDNNKEDNWRGEGVKKRRALV